jgi:hypothetical protein
VNAEVPDKYRTVGVLYAVAGLVNIMVGWFVGYMIWGVGCGTCLLIATLGLCPLGYFCGFISFLLIPLGVLELTIGFLVLGNPESVKGMVGYLPLFEIPAFLFGGIVSPVMGVVALVMLRDPEVRGYIEG